MLNINISNYGEMAQTALRDLEELVKPLGTEPEIQREIGNLQTMAKEIIRKIRGMEQILSGGTRVKRSLFFLGGRMMKYLFGTALTTDISLLNNRVEEMSHTQERIVHDVNNQITLSKIWEDHIKTNSNKLRLLLIKQAKFQTRETDKLRQNIIRWENDTDIETQQDRRTNSYLREVDVHLLRVYADVTELAMGLELAAVNRLAAILMPVDRLTEVLQQITVHLPPGLNFLRPVKSEFMYVFYAIMQVHAITYDGVIRLLIQMPLREVQSTYAV